MRNLHVKRVLNTMLLLLMLLHTANAQSFDFDPPKIPSGATLKFIEGLKAVIRDDKYGFIDSTGREVIPCIYDDANRFSEGLVAVKLDGKWGFIDEAGNTVISFKYDSALVFENGKARVRLAGREFYIDKHGNEVNE